MGLPPGEPRTWSRRPSLPDIESSSWCTTSGRTIRSFDLESRGRYAAVEAEALRAASGVLCTSRWAAAELARRYGLDDVGVAPPGVDRPDPAPGSRRTGAPRILAVGSLTPTKDQLTLIAALARVADLDWSARLVGSDTLDSGYARQIRAELSSAGLDDRVSVVGALVGRQLAAEWSAADLLVHPSRSETYGIVVLEALARGIPAIVSAGTGAVEPLMRRKYARAGSRRHGDSGRRARGSGLRTAALAERYRPRAVLACGGDGAAPATARMVGHSRRSPGVCPENGDSRLKATEADQGVRNVCLLRLRRGPCRQEHDKSHSDGS